MEQPLISVIVPVYKVEDYLDECVQSIVNQTYENLEIILVDDGSPDRCPEMCDEWAKRDSRIKVIHKENGGASSARNVGLDIAKGEYIGFVDSDDFCSETMYENLFLALRKTSRKIACCYSCHVEETGEIYYIWNESLQVELNKNEAIREIFNLNIDISMMTKLYSAELFANLRFPVGEVNEDMVIWVPLIARAEGMVATGKVEYYYRINPTGVTKTKDMFLRDENSGLVYKNLDAMKKELKRYGLKVGKEYSFFAASYAFGQATIMEKNYPLLSKQTRENFCRYRKIMMKNMWVYLVSKRISVKNKLQYILVLLRLLRIVYILFLPNRL